MSNSIFSCKEYKMVKDARRRLRKRSRIQLCCEVPLLGRSVDLAYLFNETLIAVEFKLRDWRKAVEQAYDHRLGADYTYICMPERNVTQKMQDALIQYGIGLIFYRREGRWPFREVISPQRSDEIWPSARRKAEEYIISQAK